MTTTSRLLNYCHACKYLVWSHQQEEGRIQIIIDHLDDPVFGQLQPAVQQLQGLTFYVPDSSNVDVYVRGIKLKGIQRNPADDSGVESITIPLTHLSFPY